MRLYLYIPVTLWLLFATFIYCHIFDNIFCEEYLIPFFVIGSCSNKKSLTPLFACRARLTDCQNYLVIPTVLVVTRKGLFGQLCKRYLNTCHCPLKQNFQQLSERLSKMTKCIKMFLSHVQMTSLIYQKSPIPMFFYWFSERVEK